MPLSSLKCSDFRCILSAHIDFHQGNNLIVGQNASGKTSILEAIGYLGRGRSFRGARTRDIVRHGQDQFVLFGRVERDHGVTSLGVGNGSGGLEVHIDGEKRASSALLAEALPLQIIDPDVHELIAGGPENRRRYVDWLAFHVEHGFLDVWRRYRRALKQRNAALREGADAQGLVAWDAELSELGVLVSDARERVLEITRGSLRELGEALLGGAVDLDYHKGWNSERSLSEALAANGDRDRQVGTTHSGPHRADLKLRLDERLARKLVSRGQQKLIACALIIAATEVVQTHLERPLLLLLDDPAAELDISSLKKLMGCVKGLGCQVVATTLDSENQLFEDDPRVFHVEHGVVSRVD